MQGAAPHATPLLKVLHPQTLPYAGGRIRTCEGTKPQDNLNLKENFFSFTATQNHLVLLCLKSCPFDRSGTPAEPSPRLAWQPHALLSQLGGLASQWLGQCPRLCKVPSEPSVRPQLTPLRGINVIIILLLFYQVLRFCPKVLSMRLQPLLLRLIALSFQLSKQNPC